MKLLLLLFLSAPLFLFSQTADFIVVKKKDRTVAKFFSGGEISFTSTSGTFVNAHINGIDNDTLYLQEFIIRRIPTTIGTYIIDTAGSYRYKYHYNQVAAIGRARKTNFNTRGSGAALFGGGILLTLASGVVYLADREKFSAPLLLTSIGLGTLGYFMAKGKKGGNAMYIGKKYKLVYMDMGNERR